MRLARSLVLLLLLASTVAACKGGDDTGYEMLVENKSGADLIVVMEGAGFVLPDLEGTPQKAFLAPTGAPAAVSPWVYVGWSDTARDWKSGHIRLYTSGCRAVADFEVRPGTYTLSIDEMGAASIAPYRRNELPEGTPKLAFAPHDCP